MLTTKIKHYILLVIFLFIGIGIPFFTHSFENVNSKISDKTLFIFYSSHNEKNQAFNKKLQSKLEQQTQFKHIKSIDILQTTQAQIVKHFANSNRCAITIGKPSLEKVLAIRDKTPIFSTLVSKNSLDHLINNYSRLGSQVTGIYQEQSFLRQLYLAKALNKNIESIILLLGRNTRYALPYYQEQTNRHAISLLFKILNHQSSPFQYFSTLNINNAFLLIMNSTEHYSDQDLQSLLLASYQQRIPLIGGKKTDSILAAVASVYTPTSELIDEIVSNISKVCMDKTLPKAWFSKRYAVVINQEIAQHLNFKDINQHDLKNSILISEKTNTTGHSNNE